MIATNLKRSFVAALALAAAIGLGPRAEASTIVDVELALGVDTSGSVSLSEYNLQMGGYVAAFQNTSVRNAIINSDNGIAVMLYHWSSALAQDVVAGWSHLTDEASIDTFVAALQGVTRASSGLTGIGNAINFGVSEIQTNDFDGTRLVIDISGDGTNNTGTAAATARDAAAAAGISINGLAIENEVPTLGDYYEDNLQTGANSFVLRVAGFEEFEDAVIRKIRAEITGEDPTTPTAPIPLPAAGWLLLTALGGLGVYGRKRRQAA